MLPEPEATADIERAYRNFACHLIATVFEDLKSWTAPHAELKAAQKSQLLKDFPETDLHEVFLFFAGRQGEASGLQNLIEGLNLRLELQSILAPVRPLLARALEEANRFRRSRGLDSYQTP